MPLVLTQEDCLVLFFRTSVMVLILVWSVMLFAIVPRITTGMYYFIVTV